MTDKDGNSKQGSVKNSNGDNPKEKASRNNIEGIMYGLTGGLSIIILLTRMFIRLTYINWL